jgi:hypothetical protein
LQGRILTRGYKQKPALGEKHESSSFGLSKEEQITMASNRSKLALLLSAARSVEEFAAIGRLTDLTDNDFDLEEDISENRESPLKRKIGVLITINESVPDAAESSDSSSESDYGDDSVEEIGTKVTFGHVQIREYSLTVGDHPKARAYPVALDWKYIEHDTYDVDSFEQNIRRRNWPQKGRAARRPPRLTSAQRFSRISLVSGKSDSYLYKLEQKRVSGGNEIPATACCPDDLDDGRRYPYEVVEVDDFDYQIVDV